MITHDVSGDDRKANYDSGGGDSDGDDDDDDDDRTTVRRRRCTTAYGYRMAAGRVGTVRGWV